MTREEVRSCATWIVCPMCDEPKCLGRFTCPEIEAWIDKKMRLLEEAIDKRISDGILG